MTAVLGLICGFDRLLGCFSTLLIPETKRRTLEELSGEEPSAAAALGLRDGSSGGDSIEEKPREQQV